MPDEVNKVGMQALEKEVGSREYRQMKLQKCHGTGLPRV